MKFFVWSVFWISLGLSIPVQAQLCDSTRYRADIFAVNRIDDIVYGTAQAIPAVYINESTTISQDMKLDLFQPVGDTLQKRPLLIFAFGGGFLIGSKEDEDARALCDSFARKGFVTASINYRLGMNVSSAFSGERAVYRAEQDWSAAIRYFKEYADSFRIDTNWIFAGGVSAGSISAMHCQYTSEAERPQSSFAVSFPHFAPDLGCVDCSGNSFAHSRKVKALINCWGAIGDTTWIEPTDTVPMISFHGNQDLVVPYGYGLPFTALFTLPAVYGSFLVHKRQDHVGITNQFVPFINEGHNVWGTIVSNNFVPGPTQYWAPILDSIENFVWNFLEPQTGPVSGIGFSYVTNVETYSVPSQPGFHWCWEIVGGNIVSSNLTTNSIDVQWITPGLGYVRCQARSPLDAVAMETRFPVVVGTVGNEAALAEALLKISTLEERTWVEIGNTVSGEFELKLRNLQGQSLWVSKCNSGNEMKFQLPTASLANGLYFIELLSEQGTYCQRFFVSHSFR